MAVFCSSLTSWFPGMLLIYCLNDFEIVRVAPIITCITFVFTFHISCISIVRSLYFRIFSASFLITFLSPEIASIKCVFPFHYHGLWCLVWCWGWLCQFVLVDSTIWLPCLLDSFLVILVHVHTSVFCPIVLVSSHMFKCSFVLFFHKYWACWYYVVYCLIKLLAKSALAICLCVQCFCWIIFCL